MRGGGLGLPPAPPPKPTSTPPPPPTPVQKPECVGEVYIEVHSNKCVSADVPKPDGNCVTGYEKSAADSNLCEPVGFHCPASTHVAGYSDTGRGNCVSNEAGLDYIPASGDNIFKINCVPGWHEKPNGSGACVPDGTPLPPQPPASTTLPAPTPGKKPECVGEVYIEVHSNKCVSADLPKPDGNCVTGYEKSAADSNLCEPVGFHCPAGTHVAGYSDTGRGNCLGNEAGLPMTPDDNGFIGTCPPGWHFVRTQDYVHCEPDQKPGAATLTGNTGGSPGTPTGTTTGTGGTSTTTPTPKPTTQTGTSGTGGTTTGTERQQIPAIRLLLQPLPLLLPLPQLLLLRHLQLA